MSEAYNGNMAGRLMKIIRFSGSPDNGKPEYALLNLVEKYRDRVAVEFVIEESTLAERH